MVKSLLLVALLATLANGELIFVQNLYSGYFNITCLAREYAWYGIRYPLSIVITRLEESNGTSTASEGIYGSENTFSGSNLYGDMQDYSLNPYVTIVWTESSFILQGRYICTLYGLAHNNIPLSASRELIVRAEELDPIINASPQHILDGLTPNLVVECSSASLALHNLYQPVLVELFHHRDGARQLIASASINNTYDIVTTTEDDWGVQSIYFYTNQALYFIVIKKNPTSGDAGTYTCEASSTRTFNNSEETVSIQKIVNVTASGFFVYSCDFEEGLCGFNLSTSYADSYPSWKYFWSRVLPSPGDHTLEDGTGHYLRVDFPYGIYGTALASTDFLPPVKRRFCISFWYMYPASTNSGDLTVYLRGDSGSIIFSAYGLSVTSYWNYKKIEVPAIYNPFTVEFQYQRSYSYTDAGPVYLVIDDLVVSDINCS